MAPGLYTGVRDGNKLVKVVQRGDVEQTQTHWRLPVAPRSPRLRSIRELQRHQRRRCDDDERARRSMCDAVASLPGGGAAADCIFRKGEWAYSLSKPRQALCFRVRGLLWPGLFLNSQHVRGLFFPFFFFLLFFWVKLGASSLWRLLVDHTLFDPGPEPLCICICIPRCVKDHILNLFWTLVANTATSV